jgi:hypothetical protein
MRSRTGSPRSRLIVIPAASEIRALAPAAIAAIAR